MSSVTESRDCIILYGGTFDPPHHGHVHCISVVLNRFNPNRIEMLPSASPPVVEGTLKSGVSSFSHRFNMCKLLLKDYKLNDKVLVNDVESNLDSPSYTYKTLEFMKEHILSYKKRFFVIGDDQIANFDKWYRYKDILQLVDLIVVKRLSCMNILDLKKLLESNFGLSIVAFGDYLELRLDNRTSRIYFIDTPVVDVSSTGLRKREKSNLSKSVERYIKDNKLYVGK